MQASAPFRIGQGIDVHPFAEGRKLIIGGVEVPHPFGLQGHSDADVLSHAIGDSLLGAAGLGDLGEHFPDTDAKYKNADSRTFLRQIAKLLKSAGWGIFNVDATLIAEAPRFASHVPRIKQTLAASLEISPDQINIKATTTEELGFTGRREGIAAMAVALIGKTEPKSSRTRKPQKKRARRKRT